MMCTTSHVIVMMCTTSYSKLIMTASVVMPVLFRLSAKLCLDIPSHGKAFQQHLAICAWRSHIIHDLVTPRLGLDSGMTWPSFMA